VSKDKFETKLLSDLIAVDTSVPPGKNYREALKIVGESLEQAGFEAEYAVTPSEVVRKHLYGPGSTDLNERVNLVAKWGNESGRRLLLNAHVDVVPPGPNWTKDPFEMRIEGSKLFGRGASDDKGCVAAIAASAVRLAQSHVKIGGEVIVAVTCDEEIGGRTGLGYLVGSGLTADAAIVGDGSIKTVGIAANGCMRFNVKVLGKAAHSSRNWLGINAIEKASELIQTLSEYNAALAERRSEVPADPDTGVEFLRPSLTVAMIRGGVKENVVPPICEIVVDRRLIPEENWEEAKNQVVELLESLKERDKQFQYEVSFEPQNHFSFKVSEKERIVGLYADAWRSVMRAQPVVAGGLGCVDSCYVAAKGIPVVTGGVGRTGNSVHSADEFVLEEDLVNFGRIVELTTKNFLGSIG
jgi:succinyl-diaminopimelate desuccinylase